MALLVTDVTCRTSAPATAKLLGADVTKKQHRYSEGLCLFTTCYYVQYKNRQLQRWEFGIDTIHVPHAS